MDSRIYIELFGGLRVRTERGVVSRFRTQKTATLLAYLAANPAMHPRDEIAVLVWPDTDIESARMSLRTALAAIRKHLDEASPNAAAVLVADRQCVGLDLPQFQTDVQRFDRLVTEAAAEGDASRRAEIIRTATELYAGPFLPEVHDLWAAKIRERLAADYQRVTGMASVESPARSPDSTSVQPSSTLPLPFTRFFGRELEIQAIFDALERRDSRLITLTGPGGSGKTRLALEVARRWADLSGEIPVFVSLADITQSTFLADAILQAMQVDRLPGMDAAEQLSTVLAGPERQKVVILDNFEQLVESGAALLLDLLASAPNVTLLVTSRQRLDLGGEREIPVPPLPTPRGPISLEQLARMSSVELFVDRARGARSGFTLTDANAPAVSAICQRLDGIPLAIELAAAWCGALTPTQILDRLERSSDILSSRRKDLAPRHRTLRATVEWSYRLLTPELQRFFARLSVFRGGWPLEGAEIVCADPDAITHLHLLLDRSLILAVESGEAMRYRFLETLREFAAEQLSAEEAGALRERHLRWCLRIAESARAHILGAEQGEWLRRLDAEHDNFRAALEGAVAESPEVGLRLATALDRFWEVRGLVSEGAGWLERSLDAAPISSPMRPLALDLAGRFAWFSNRFDLAARRFEESLELSRAISPEAAAGPLAHLARMKAFVEGDTQGAMPLLLEALELTKRSGDIQQIQDILEMLCQVALIAGDIDTAVRRGAEWLEAARKAGDSTSIIGALTMSGIALMNAGNTAKAAVEFEEAIALAEELGERYWSAGSYWGLGVISFQRGELDAAAARFRASLEKLRDTGFDVVKHFVLEVLGFLAATRGEPDRCARLLGAVYHLRRLSQAPVARILYLDFSRHVEGARAAIGDPAYEAAFAAGGRMSMAEAVEYALQGLNTAEATLRPPR